MPSIWGTSLEEHRALVLGRLVDAFAELVAERGIEGTTLAAVAERAGIARSAIYNHVRDKHDLFLAHTERSLRRARDQLEESQDTDASAVDRLGNYIRVAFRSWITEPGAGADLLAQLDEAQRARLFEQLAPLSRILRSIVEDGIASGEFRPAPPERLIGFVSASLEGHRLSLGTGRLDPDEVAAEVQQLLLHGLAGPA